MRATLSAVEVVATEQRLDVELFWPNSDAGTDGTSRAIREWLNRFEPDPFGIRIRTHRAMPPGDYARMMAACKVLVGNSSSGLREGAWIGTPVVNVGGRQRGREHGPNVIAAEPDRGGIAVALSLAIGRGPQPANLLYGDGTAGERVADAILGIDEAAAKRRLEEGIRARL